uniref:Methyltransferase domain-containing protein n=1 Tax=Moorena producens (strain JHB) TaxID=1454205 RepID=A0A1D9G4F6_MOOP1
MSSNFFSIKEKFFDLWAPNYDILFTTVFYQALHKRLLEYVELTNQPNVLDLGCGTGRLLNRLAQEQGYFILDLGNEFKGFQPSHT